MTENSTPDSSRYIGLRKAPDSKDCCPEYNANQAARDGVCEGCGRVYDFTAGHARGF